MKKTLITLMFVAISGLFISCEELAFSGTVKYEVTCNPSGFDVTYENSNSNTEQQSISSSSWSTSFKGYSEEFVYISAQASNENASVTVKISYKGDVIEETSSSGDYVIATASGTLP